MAQVLRRLSNSPTTVHDDLIVGISTSDDAGVYRLSDDLAMVQTVDYFTPIVDDAADWGRIAAANALSDVYAMGATPLTALSIVGWPREALSMELLGDVLEGAADKLEEAKVTLLGGHSIADKEPKYGLAVTGIVHPDQIITNAGGKQGDRLVLTKPLGTGIIATAIKRQLASPEMTATAVEVMETLNKSAADAMRRVGVVAATDVTGYGLLGHLGEMLRASGVSAEIELAAVPVLDGVRDLIAEGVIPGGTKRNHEAISRFTQFGDLGDDEQYLLSDAQTSGGLLMAVDGPLTAALIQALSDEGVVGYEIGSLVERRFEDGPGSIVRIR
ncbi:MAG: selenide, water dikinase SelD [Acidimicrobiia bacterium]|nr:selenide, water dikinase SelD [Acidimicrobiia bacterium]